MLDEISLSISIVAPGWVLPAHTMLLFGVLMPIIIVGAYFGERDQRFRLNVISGSD
ncbi:hypothetical protein [Burkholderia sp. LMG 32019]|uniref:hypothetical protein n=1 Tax=Burkholderia sp. LMG 32019 TaxID=3158173 RepID=UPI003C2FA789